MSTDLITSTPGVAPTPDMTAKATAFLPEFMRRELDAQRSKGVMTFSLAPGTSRETVLEVATHAAAYIGGWHIICMFLSGERPYIQLFKTKKDVKEALLALEAMVKKLSNL